MLSATVLDTNISIANIDHVVDKIISWAGLRSSRTVCLVNTHMLCEALDNKSLANALSYSDINCADGMPIVRVLNTLGYSDKSVSLV